MYKSFIKRTLVFSDVFVLITGKVLTLFKEGAVKMATWLTHLRVADKVCDNFKTPNKSLYFAGSIAPDTGISPDISHWCVNGDKSECDVETFYEKYILNCEVTPERDFYLGYLVHLWTDVLWQKQIIKPLLQQGTASIKEAKQRWKDVDIAFLNDHKNFRSFKEMIEPEKYLKKWFDYYSESQVKELVESILNSAKINPVELTNVDVIAQKEIEQFIEESSTRICQEVKIFFK